MVIKMTHDHKGNDCRAHFDTNGDKIKCPDCDVYKNECARSVEVWKRIDGWLCKRPEVS